jgi:Xaa-Pro aminopeptidase
MTILARVLPKTPLAADQDGYPGILGYDGPALSEVTGASVATLGAYIEGRLRIKSPAEVELIRQSARWCEYAHRLLQEYSTAGATEAEASLRAGQEATLAMLKELGSEYAGQLGSQDGATAGYRGQIGRRAAWAHAVAHNNTFQPGDMLVSETAAPFWGYNAELERGMVVGEPTDEQRELHHHTVEAQVAAFEAFRTAGTCADVDNAVLAYLDDNGIRDLWRQHTGHGIGLRNHEAPFLDEGDHTPLEPGMVFTIEPGVYKEGLGGFRHSDTVLVTGTGIELLTDYPRDLESLTLG